MKALLFWVTVIFSCTAEAAVPSEWVAARNSHFEVYSQAGSEAARLTLTRFEELRSFFARNRLFLPKSPAAHRPPVRIIEFKAKRDFDAFKSRSVADAYYTGAADRDYIVMPALESENAGIAAHEYAHFVLHSSSLRLPAWLSEGLAELFSTVEINRQACRIGGAIPGRMQTLHRQSWLSASQLLSAEESTPWRQTRSGADIFYSESWALVDMLTSSPQYTAGFASLVETLSTGESSSEQVLLRTYGHTAAEILIDTQAWVRRNGTSRRTLAALGPAAVTFATDPLSAIQMKAVLAEMFLSTGEWGRARLFYEELLQLSPKDPQILGSLGAISLHGGENQKAANYWQMAMDHGLDDPALCYQYALLAEDMKMPPSEIDRALETAIAAKNDFDDARYKLALRKSNAGEFAAAVDQLRSMTSPAGKRAFGYWATLSYALTEVGRRDEAETAAAEAKRVAASGEERNRASMLSYIAKTDLVTRFERNSDGNLQLVTTRVPHGTTDFNPFVEPGERIQTEVDTLLEVQCSQGRLTAFVVEKSGKPLSLSVPDPSRVLMRDAPQEFSCGPQAAAAVKVEYVASSGSGPNTLRGMQFLNHSEH